MTTPSSSNSTDQTSIEALSIAYSWLRNDRPLNDATNAHYRAFEHNGTLRLSHAKIAAGRFRCVAEDRLYRTGAIVSTASHVQQTGKFGLQRCNCILFLLFALSLSLALRDHSLQESPECDQSDHRLFGWRNAYRLPVCQRSRSECDLVVRR